MSQVSQSRFGQSADDYVAYRPEYPAELFERILALTPVEMRRRAMDLGAGTGRSTGPLLSHFHEIVAVEPDPLMVDKLRSRNPRLLVKLATAEEVTQEPESVDLITIGAALYWMDVPRVMLNISSWLRTGGVVAIWAGGLPRSPEATDRIVVQEFADRWNRFRDPSLDLAVTSEHARHALSGFTILEEHVLLNLVWLTPREFVGFWRSTSYGSAYGRSLAVPEAYWRDLEARFHSSWPNRKIPIDFGPWLLLARKD